MKTFGASALYAGAALLVLFLLWPLMAYLYQFGFAPIT